MALFWHNAAIGVTSTLARGRPERAFEGATAMVSGRFGQGCEREHRQFEPIGDQNTLHQRFIEVSPDDIHQSVSNLGVSGIDEPLRLDLS